MANTIHLDAPIGNEPGELSSRWLRSQLNAANGQDVTLHVHSEGGSVFEGLAMHDAIKSYGGRVHAVVSSMALSAAAIVLAACDEVSISRNGYIMVHNAHMDFDSTPSETQLLQSMSERMRNMFADWTRQPKQRIAELMQDEVFLDASTAVRMGFANRIIDTIAARCSTRIAASTGHTAKARWRAAIASTGLPFAKGALLIEKQQPQLRQTMIQEANAGRQHRR